MNSDYEPCEICGEEILPGDALSCEGYDFICEYCYDTQTEETDYEGYYGDLKCDLERGN